MENIVGVRGDCAKHTDHHDELNGPGKSHPRILCRVTATRQTASFENDAAVYPHGPPHRRTPPVPVTRHDEGAPRAMAEHCHTPGRRAAEAVRRPTPVGA